MANDIDAHVGQRLRQRRWLLGLTQQQLGDRIGIKFQQVQKYETGQNRISASRLWELASATSVDISYFFEGLDVRLQDVPEKNGAVGPADSGSGDLMTDREAIELVRAYYATPEAQRRRLFDLVKAMGSAASDAEAGEAAPAETKLERQAS